ncbi:tetratricopeptide repeat protein [bacterium]|nr:tetratricopeptide repeat protein [bacterium]
MSPVERMALRAEQALEDSDPEAAIEYYQAALEISPMNRDLREGLSEALVMRAELAASVGRTGSSWRDPVPMRERPPASPPRKPKRPRPRPRPLDEDKPKGFELLDIEEQEEAQPPEPVAPRRRRKPRPEPPRRSPRSRRFNSRALTMSLIYAAGLLIIAGVLHGMITGWMIPSSLPEIPEEKPLPAALTTGLDEASELLYASKPGEALDALRLLKLDFPQHAAAISAAMVQAHRSMGARLLDEREYDKAADAYKAATELDEQDASNWIDLARTYREHGRTVQSRSSSKGRQYLQDAITAYQKALEVSPNDPAALFGLAQVHAFLNDRSHAVEFYEKVISTAQDSPEAKMARQNLAQLTGR